MRRYEAIETICQSIGKNDAVVSSTGLISRDLLAIKDSSQNFYMVGSMGLASSIGLGLALCQSDRRVVIIEGDGSILMNMGSMSTIAHFCPRNLLHIVLDNEAYDSSGGQPTTSKTTKLEDVARATGYRFVRRVDSRNELQQSLTESNNQGPIFILVKIEKDGSKNSPRVLELEETKKRFQEWLRDTTDAEVNRNSQTIKALTNLALIGSKASGRHLL